MLKSIKKNLIYVATLGFGMLFSFSFSINLQIPNEHAQPDVAVVGPTQIEATESDLFNIINLINDYLRFSIGVICLGALVYGGFLLITAQGSEDKLKKANKILMGALVGILISIFSYAVIRLVVNLFQ